MRIEPSKERAARYDAIVCKSPGRASDPASERASDRYHARGCAALLFFVWCSSVARARATPRRILRASVIATRAGDVDSREARTLAAASVLEENRTSIGCYLFAASSREKFKENSFLNVFYQRIGSSSD